MNTKVESVFQICAVVELDPFGESRVVHSQNCTTHELKAVKAKLRNTYKNNTYKIVTGSCKIILH